METKIKLNTMEEVKEFVDLEGHCYFDIDVFYNRVIIDAKSILGVLSLDLAYVLTVQCHGEAEAFLEQISKFQPAEAVA